MKKTLMTSIVGACLLLFSQLATAENGAAPLLEKSDMCRSALFATAGYLMKEKLDPSVVERIYLDGEEPSENFKPYLQNAEALCESTGQPMVNMITLAFVMMQP